MGVSDHLSDTLHVILVNNDDADELIADLNSIPVVPGGGLLRAYNDPAEALANVTIYVTAGGDDTTGVAGNPALPFATLQGALRAVPEATVNGGYGATSYTIDIAAGTYDLPVALPLWAGVSAVNCAQTLVDARNVLAVVNNTLTTGNAVTVDGGDVTTWIDQVVKIETALGAHVCYATILGATTILGVNTLYFETDVATTANPAINPTDVFRRVQDDVLFSQSGFATVLGFGSPVGSLTWTGGDFRLNSCWIEANASFSGTFQRAKLGALVAGSTSGLDVVSCSAQLLAVQTGANMRIRGGVLLDQTGGGPLLIQGGGVLGFRGCNAVINGGASPAINGWGSGNCVPNNSTVNVLRVVNCREVLTANTLTQPEHPALNGNYALPTCVTESGLTGVSTWTVRARGGAHITIGAGSAVVSGGVTNKVSADNGTSACATAADGTRISGGAMTPGVAGYTSQNVTAAGTTAIDLNVSSRWIAFTSSAGAPIDLQLPAGSSVSEGVFVDVSTLQPTFDCTITPAIGDQIDGANWGGGALNLSALSALPDDVTVRLTWAAGAWQISCISVSPPAAASNEFLVDTALVTLGYDLPLRRMYGTVAAAAIAANVAGLSSFVVKLIAGQTPTWDLSGWDASSVMTIASDGGQSAQIALTAGATDLAGTGGTLRFDGVTVAHGGAMIDATSSNQLEFDSCRVISLTGQTFTGWGTVIRRNSQFIGTRFLLVGAGGLGSFGCDWSPGAGFVAGQTIHSLAETITSNSTGDTYELKGADTATLFTRTANTPVLKFHGSTISVENTALTTTIFDNVNLNVELRNAGISRTGAGLVNLGAATFIAAAGLNWHGADPDDATLPAGSWHNVAGVVTQV